ncbi:MAG: AAA family ATPase [Clostridium sp.]|jgi:exodeoxyribonuclease V alpha subunit|uniref:AAA family ATPase n=2 Tax=Clostridium sp. TaxID=1506 RepID=UPI0025C5B188|nr:AAA family ATPase [Clostridium sp.]MCI9304046.1 AAA family ATPase [Clostridium sp.]
MIKCKMKIDRIMFPKDREVVSGDFCIFTAKVIEHLEGDYPSKHNFFNTVSLKGVIPEIRVGEVFTIKFDNPEENKFGISYSVLSITKDINPSNKEEVNDYLKLMCGDTIAKELIKLDNPYQLLINREDEELLKVKGIKEARLKQIYKKIDTYSDNSLAFIKLEPLGLSKNQIKNICYSVGGAISAIDICMKNPYLLIKKVRGIGFKLADEIAIKCGISPFSEERIKAAITYILETNGEAGKSFLFTEQLLQELRKIVCIEFKIIESIVNNMLVNEDIYISEDGKKIALPYYVKLEQDIAKEIIRIRDAKSAIEVPRDWKETVKKMEEKQGWQHTEEQLLGIEMVLNNNIVVVSGKAGSGKSTVTNAMAEVLGSYDIALCCLSAKAAQRLREVTGMEASTIHKLLGLGVDGEGDNVLYEDIIIIDEASMISGTLFLKLLRAIKNGAKVIILGDDGQLTAIGNCSVFSDLMVSKKIPHIELTKIHRQAERSAIITKSIDFRNQVPICESDFKGHTTMGELQDLELFVIQQEEILNQVKNKFLEDLKFTNNILEVQVISALKTRGLLSVQNINLELQALVNNKYGKSFLGANDTRIFVGDKVINLKNNYGAKNAKGKRTGVWNGSIGIVEKILDNELLIDFVGIGKIIIEKEYFKNINLAYAITCHSSQGSQWERIICTFDFSAYILLNVEMIYTALTRASKHCSLIIEKKALDFAARTIEQKTKQTLLPIFLKNFE